MTTPRLVANVCAIQHNASALVQRLGARGVSVTGVMKAVCGHPAIAQAMISGGVAALADSRLSNVQRLRDAGLSCPITLIRAPLLSQVEEVVKVCEASCQTDLNLIKATSAAALKANLPHDLIVMIEMGDQREGVLPEQLPKLVAEISKLKGVRLRGLGANFACLGAAAPTSAAMQALSALVQQTERQCDHALTLISGGNSSNLPLFFGHAALGRVNNLRLGEAILLGTDPLSAKPIAGLRTDTFCLYAEVIEISDTQPSPNRILLALGKQDIDIDGLSPPKNMRILGATSDHLIVETSRTSYNIGATVAMTLNYSALMHAMSAPDMNFELG